MKTLLISSRNIEQAQQALNKFFYSTSYIIHENLIIENSNGIRNELFIKKERNRIKVYTNAF